MPSARSCEFPVAEASALRGLLLSVDFVRLQRIGIGVEETSFLHADEE
jgi:hypothetical protein